MAKRNVEYELTWIESRRAWRKIRKGRSYSFKALPDESKEESYARAILLWRSQLQELRLQEGAPINQAHLGYLKDMFQKAADYFDGLQREAE